MLSMSDGGGVSDGDAGECTVSVTFFFDLGGFLLDKEEVAVDRGCRVEASGNECDQRSKSGGAAVLCRGGRTGFLPLRRGNPACG